VSRRGVLLLAAVVAALALVATARRPEAPAPAARPASRPAQLSPQVQAAATEAAPDPATIRDLFRFADRPLPPASGASRPAARPVPVEAAPDPEAGWPRLVGLVRRQGRLFAAFAAGGDVVLAGPGDEAVGVSVLEVGDEGVLVRRPDGTTRRLALP
jgi:hypothetical protein